MELPGMGYTNIRELNVGYLKQYTPNNFKLVHMNSVRSPGFEERNKPKQQRQSSSAANKLQNSLSRSRSAVLELALCNPWSYFVTLTLSPEKNDRHDLNAAYKRLSKWLNNYSRTGAQIKYLIIPEPHNDGAWHFHGLLSGLPPPHLTPFTLHDPIPHRIKDMLSNGRMIYNWPAYAKAFGYVTIEPILDPSRCAIYMTKYITKELGESGIELNHHLYYCSQGLHRAELVYRGEMKHPLINPDYENEYVHTKSFSSIEEAMPYFCD